jgi:hypothetical protein
MAARRSPTEPFWQFCAALNRFGVDFDVFVRPSTANLFRVKAALEASGLGDHEQESERPAEGSRRCRSVDVG